MAERATLHTIREVAVRYVGAHRRIPAAIKGPEQVAAYLRRRLPDDSREHFVAIYLDGRHRPIADRIVSIGTTASLFHPREVFQPPVALGACGLIVAHNHPSQDPTPSIEDRDVTTRLAAEPAKPRVAVRLALAALQGAVFGIIAMRLAESESLRFVLYGAIAFPLCSAVLSARWPRLAAVLSLLLVRLWGTTCGVMAYEDPSLEAWEWIPVFVLLGLLFGTVANSNLLRAPRHSKEDGPPCCSRVLCSDLW